MTDFKAAAEKVERQYAAVTASAGADEHGAYLEVAGVRVRTYLAGGVVNVSIEPAAVSTEGIYAFHVEGVAATTWKQRAGVPRSLLA